MDLSRLSRKKSTLSEGSILEQRYFLRSFIERIDFNHPRIRIEHNVQCVKKRAGLLDTEVLPTGSFSSPNRPVGRTFTAVYYLPEPTRKTTPTDKPKKLYRNPVFVAEEW